MSDKKNKSFNHADYESKQTEVFGNVQLGFYYTQDQEQIRKDFDNLFCSMGYVDSYMFILHDDSDYLHVHFILLLKVQVRMSTLCNYISKHLGPNGVDIRAISIDKLVSIVGALHYVLHTNEESIEDGKKEYKPCEILSNESPLIIQGYLDSEDNNNVSINLIRQLVIECPLKSDVLIRLRSDKLIRKNRYYIDTMWNDKPLLQLRQREYDGELPF